METPGGFASRPWDSSFRIDRDCDAHFHEVGDEARCIRALHVILLAIVSFTASGWGARAQTVSTYYVNDGKSGTFDLANGEFGTDVGGYIPFSDYLDLNHYYTSRWNPSLIGGRSFFAEMLLNMTDLKALNTDIGIAAFGATPILPFPPSVISGGSPVVRQTWWGQEVIMWPYMLNGAPLLICIKGNGSGQPSPGTTVQLLLKNYARHDSYFGTNKNHDHTDPNLEYYQEFQAPDPESGWQGPPGSRVLGIEEQALNNGDVVVVSQETYSANLWFALQRTQEANEFVRSQFLPTNFSTSGVGLSFVYGGSWGGVVSGVLALLQPHIYAASGGWTVSDLGYGIGDHQELLSFHAAALGLLVPADLTAPNSCEFESLIDLLGIRFDASPSGYWDLAAFSPNRRPGELLVKIYAQLRNEDISMNGFWALKDNDSTINPKFDVHLRRFMEHGAAWGVVPGKNEYALDSGTEWLNIVTNGASTAPTNVPIIPTYAAPTAPHGPYPTPYTTTLRHDSSHTANVANFLVPYSLAAAGNPNQPSTIPTLGQGTWPGYRDSMRLADIDGDGRPEILFGNLDGFVHDLEFNNDPGDPFRLDDQFKSAYLGRGLFATAGTGSGSSTVGYVANSRGQVWKLNYNGSFSMTPFIQPDGFNSYDGETPQLFVGNFDPSNPNDEVLLLNRFLDWSLYSATTGAPLSLGRLTRSTHGVGPTQATMADVDNDGDMELLVPAIDGHVWLLDPFKTVRWPKAVPDAYVPFTNRALFRVVACNFSSSGLPTHLLVFGRNDDLNDNNSLVSNNVIMLFDTSTTPPTKVIEVRADRSDAFSPEMSFAWINKPVPGSTTADFVVSGGISLQKFRITIPPPPPYAITPQALVPLIVSDPDIGARSAVSSIEVVPINGAKYVVVALGNGRIYVFDSNLLAVRNSDREAPGIQGPKLWYSNRTLAQCMACDLVQDGNGTDADLYFADYGEAIRSVNGVPSYRLGRLHVPIASGSPSWIPYVSDIKNPSGSDLFRGANRTLLYRDLDNDGHREPHVFAETGAAYLDSYHSGQPIVVREFCTYSIAAPFNYDPYAGPPYSQRIAKGGNVFEYFDPISGSPFPRYNYLGGFNVPADAFTPFEFFASTNDWYPAEGTKLDGQVACYSQSALPSGYGTSMRIAMLRTNSSANTRVPHVVIGTNGGCVFAIEPGPQGSGIGIKCPSSLRYASTCFGSYLIGMDVGNLDSDADDEIAVGSWIDKGTYFDWLNNVTTTNRGHLYILDPVPATGSGVGTFNVTDLNVASDTLLGAGNGIGTGVTGVRIDDVNNDGVKEIWCSDAIGHLYLFRNQGSSWNCFYRSVDLGAYPGAYNNIFPMKNSQGKTTKLVVVSAGYIMAFTVDPSLL